MFLIELQWSLFQAKALVCSMLVLLCVHTATGTATSHLFMLRVSLVSYTLTRVYMFVFALTQGCQVGMDVWMVRIYSQPSKKTAAQEKSLLNSWLTPQWKGFSGP